MPVIGIDHVNIRTSDVEASARFYVEIFDFEYRQGPVVMNNQSHWLFDRSGAAIIHFRMMEADGASTGPIDHIALACEGKEEIIARLALRGIEYSVFENVAQRITQLFVRDPHGVMLELNFAATDC